MVTPLHSVLPDLVLDPPLEVEGSCKHGVTLRTVALRASVTDVTVKFPSAVHLANVWATRVSVATGFSRVSSISSTDHSVCDCDAYVLEVLSVADLVRYGWQHCLLQVCVHVSWVLDLAPTCDIALMSWLYIGFWQTDWLHPLVEYDGLLQLEQGDVVVEVAPVVLLMHEHLLDLHVNL